MENNLKYLRGDYLHIEAISFQPFKELRLDGFDSIPNEKGIYVVIVPELFNVEFSEDTTAIKSYKERNLLYTSEELRTKYNCSDQKMVYIGKAGGKSNKLRQRIRQYVRYGYCEANNHRGGRAIWQIENNKQLLIGYLPCDAPEAKESQLLAEYYYKYGTFPVANWKG